MEEPGGSGREAGGDQFETAASKDVAHDTALGKLGQKGGEAAQGEAVRSDPNGTPGSLPEWSIATWTIVLAIATIVLCVIAFGQAILFFYQLKYMRNSLKDTKDAADAARDSANAANASVKLASDTAERQLRAYIFMTHVSVDRVYGSDNTRGFKFVPHWKNLGSTPGTITEIVITTRVVTDDSVNDIDWTDKEFNPSVINVPIGPQTELGLT